MPIAPLTIRLGTKKTYISVAALARALESALEMLRSLEHDFVPADQEIRWEVVRARMQSPLTLTFSPRAKGRPAKKIGDQIAKACLRGIQEIEQEATLPEHFKEETLLAAQDLIATVEKDGAKLTLSSNGRRVSPTPEALKNIDAIIQTARVYLDYGTIEGRLEIVSVHNHKSFFVFETLTNYRVECLGDKEQFQQALSLLEKRVAISGRIRYRNHKPVTTNVEQIRVLRDSADLPQPETMPPIDITSGLSSEEHVRKMRDAQ